MNEVKQVMKSHGNTQPFDSKKIYKAITQAMKCGSGILNKRLANLIVEETVDKFSKKKEISTEEIDKFILNKLNEYGQNLTANSYERYKTIKAYQKQKDIIDEEISGIVNQTNKAVLDENSNKDGRLISTQRDLIAGTHSRSYSERVLLPTHILHAHQEGLIHIHDTDYLIHDGCFNCFSQETSFITDKGLKSFKDFKDGDVVIVPTHKGNWKKAVVHSYGSQEVYRYRISLVDREGYGIDIKATANHRWFDENGKEQIGLEVGDRLLTVNHLIGQFDFDTADEHLKKMWCYGFVLADGCTKSNRFMYSHGLGKRPVSDSAKGWRTDLILCDHKTKFLPRFEELGYHSFNVCGKENRVYVEITDFNKKDFLENEKYKDLTKEESIALFNGLLCGDGVRSKNGSFQGISSSNEKIIDIIKRFADLSGWFITSYRIIDTPTNFGERSYPLHDFCINTYLPIDYQKNNGIEVTRKKTLKVVEKEFVGVEEVWCLDVEDDHSFILEGGIPTGNCMLINVKDMLDKGTVINGHMIERPKSLMTAATIASQISLQISNGQHGGQTITLSHLAPYVRVSREKIYKNEKKHHPDASEEEIRNAVEDNLRQEIASAMQTLQYQENTFSSANGQTPFVSLFLYISEDKEYEEETAMLIEEVLKQRLLGMKNEDGVYVTPAFPKLLFVLDENNVPENSKYHYLFKLAVKCSAKRMNPDYISAKIMRQQFDNEVFPCMGCRSFLSPWKDENGKYKWYGRFNRGVVTINLVDVALSSNGDEELFWNILDARLELAKEALIIKDKKLVDASPTVSPSHWMYGGIARLKKEDTITPLLRGGYSSISLGYIGVYEMCMIMTKQSHTQPKGNEFAKRVLKYLEQKTIEWREIPNLNGCSLYGTPSESLCYKFALKTQKRFGVIPGITDKDWFTNSYHVCVYEPIDAFKKFKLESEFQKMSKGGAVSYVEVPDMTDNLPALEEIVRYMYDTIQYAEINTRNGDYCDSCGFEGEIKQDDEGEWYCPQCGEKRRAHLHLVRRVCGYVSTTMPNHGKAMEMKNRVYHIGEE